VIAVVTDMLCNSRLKVFLFFNVDVLRQDVLVERTAWVDES
jgi:hypothetical protein